MFLCFTHLNVLHRPPTPILKVLQKYTHVFFLMYFSIYFFCIFVCISLCIFSSICICIRFCILYFYHLIYISTTLDRTQQHVAPVTQATQTPVKYKYSYISRHIYILQARIYTYTVILQVYIYTQNFIYL